MHSNCWCPIMHTVFVVDNELPYFRKFLSQIIGHLELLLASLALNFSSDVKDSILQNMIEVVNGYSAISDPYERDKDN